MNNAAIQYAGSSGGSAELTAAEQAGLAKAAALTKSAAQIDAAAAAVIDRLIAGPCLVVAAVDSAPRLKALANYVCDGVDDQVEIQAAIAALTLTNLAGVIPGMAGGLTGYGKVLLCQGAYRITASIVPASGMWLEGQGPWNTFLVQAADCTLIRSAGGTFFTRFSNFGCEGRWKHVGTNTIVNPAAGLCGIEMVNDADFLIENCWAENFSGVGFSAFAVWNNKIANCKAEYCGTGILGFGEVANCHSIYNNVGLMCRETRVIGGLYRANRQHGITTQQSNNRIIGARVEYNWWDAVNPLVETGGTADVYKGQINIGGVRDVVMGCYINSVRYTDPATRASFGIEDSGTDSIIVDNHIINYKHWAIQEVGSGSIGHYNIRTDTFVAAAADADAIVADMLPVAGSVAAGSISQPDVPRTLTYTLTDADASVSAMAITVKGITAMGAQASETITKAAGILDHGVTYAGAIPFVRVNTISMTVTGAAAGDLIKIGTGNGLGLSGLATMATATTSFGYRAPDILSVTDNAAPMAAGWTLDATHSVLHITAGVSDGHTYVVRFRAAKNIERTTV